MTMPLYYWDVVKDKLSSSVCATCQIRLRAQLDSFVLLIQYRRDRIKFDVVPGSERGDREGQRNGGQVQRDRGLHLRQHGGPSIGIVFYASLCQHIGHGGIAPAKFPVGLFEELGQKI